MQYLCSVVLHCTDCCTASPRSTLPCTGAALCSCTTLCCQLYHVVQFYSIVHCCTTLFKTLHCAAALQCTYDLLHCTGCTALHRSCIVPLLHCSVVPHCTVLYYTTDYTAVTTTKLHNCTVTVLLNHLPITIIIVQHRNTQLLTHNSWITYCI